MKRIRTSLVLLTATATLLLGGCGRSEPTHPMVRGVIEDVRADRHALIVKHEDIPGVMPAMTMSFQVDEKTLAAARKGQAISGRLVRKSNGLWIEDARIAP